MKTLPLELSTPGYWDNTLNDADGRVNMYSQKCGDKWRLASYPGLKLFGTVGNNLPCRGAHSPPATPLFAYSVHGTKIYRISVLGATLCTNSLDAAAISNTVQMSSNKTHLLIVDGLFGYYMDFTSDTIIKITDLNFSPNPLTCAFLNSRFIVGSGQGSDVIIESALDDVSVWTPSLFAQAELAGDGIAGLFAGGDRLHVLGQSTYQVFYPTEGSNPFTNMSGASLDIGGLDTYSHALHKEVLYFMANPITAQYGQVYRIAGGSLEKISTLAIEALIKASTTGLFGWCYSYQGQDFYELIQGYVPSDPQAFSIVYNITTNSWSITKSGASPYTKRRLSMVINSGALGYPIGFDYLNGNFYTLQPDYNTENGQALIRQVSFVIEPGNDTVFHNNVRVALEVKLDALSTFDFTGKLQWSDDGGATYNTGETVTKTITGTVAQKAILRFDNLGSVVGERRYRLTMDLFPGSITIRSADITLDKGGF